MSRLLKKLNEYVTQHGNVGKAELCKATNRGMRVVERWISGQVIPRRQTRHQIAIVCGCSPEEAMELAQEPTVEVKEAG